MGLFTGRERRGVFPEPPIPPFPGADMGGNVNVSSKPDAALQVPTVWACVDLIASSVAMMPLETFRRPSDPLAAPQRLPDPKMVTAPDGVLTQSEWLHMLMVSLLLRGNAFGLMDLDTMARPAAVHLLNPDSVKVDVDRDTGEVTYRWTNRPDAVIPKDRMWHVRGLTLPGQQVGLSPIAYAAAVLGLDLSSRQFAGGLFDGGGIPKAIIESDQQINQTQAVSIKDRFMASVRGREPVVMGMGLKYTPVQLKPEESQFLATQQANVAQICRYFRVPSAMVDGPSGHGMTYTNTEQRGIEFLTYTLGFWLKRIEDAYFSLLPGSQFTKFNPSALLRLDGHTQSQVDLLDLAGKVVVPSEIRARRGLPPMTEAQKQEAEMVPLKISPLGRPAAIGNIEDNPLAAAAPPASENPTGA